MNIFQRTKASPRFSTTTSPWGARNAKDVLVFANKGKYQKVENEMNRFVYITEKGKDGKPSKKKFSNGLANRRKREVVPFQIKP
ncbi:MAG: hypothetical protein KKG07_09585 [Gammaproteobacteria bacterium]|nr:hypothetical protein [Gammaproteobacteria bacterium]